MGATENKIIIQNMFAEMAKGNLNAFVETMADDARWTTIGSTRFSGTYQGKAQVLEKLMAPLAQEVDGGFTLTPHNFLADGDYVIIQASGQAKTLAGKSYNNTYCLVYRLANGKIQEGIEYLDTEAVTLAFGK